MDVVYVEFFQIVQQGPYFPWLYYFNCSITRPTEAFEKIDLTGLRLMHCLTRTKFCVCHIQ